MELLKKLCQIHAPSGNEILMKEFILNYVHQNQNQWLVRPQIIVGDDFQDCIMLVFGQPRTAVFAHMDSIGFTVRYGKELLPIGGPYFKTGYELIGEDSKGKIECKILVHEDDDEHDGKTEYEFEREVDRGTELVFKCNFIESEDTIQSCYLDNRLGVWNALKLAETLQDGVLVFSCWEEHAGGSVAYLAKYLFEVYKIRQGLISDITWVTEGVHVGKGVAISMRDRYIPRRSFLNKIIAIAKDAGLTFQLEVEGAGASDGRELQLSPYPFDWCFIGAPEKDAHTPHEVVHKDDITSMLEMYKVLMDKL